MNYKNLDCNLSALRIFFISIFIFAFCAIKICPIKVWADEDLNNALAAKSAHINKVKNNNAKNEKRNESGDNHSIKLEIVKDVHKFSDTILTDNKPKVLFFFASWCMHCKIAFPRIIELAKKYAGKVSVFIVSLDTNEGSLRRFIAGKKVNHDQTLFLIDGINKGKLDFLFSKLGMEYSSAVPNISLLDSKNKLLIDNTTHIAYIENIIDDMMVDGNQKNNGNGSDKK